MPFELFAKIKVDGSEVGRALSTLKNQLATVFSIGALAGITRRTIDFGSSIADTAKKIGLTTDELQEFSYAAKITGASIDNIAAAFKGLSKANAEIMAGGAGGERMKKIFSLFGVDPAKSLAEQFRQVGETIRTTGFGQQEIALVNELLGRSGQELIPAFREGLVGLAAEAKTLGQVIDGSMVRALDNYGDALDRLEGRWKKFVSRTIVETVAFWKGVGRFLTADKTGQSMNKSVNDFYKEALGEALFKPTIVPDRKPADAAAVAAALATETETRTTARGEGRRGRAEMIRDDLTRIGGFAGTPGRMTELQERIARATEETARNTGKKTSRRFP